MEEKFDKIEQEKLDALTDIQLAWFLTKVDKSAKLQMEKEVQKRFTKEMNNLNNKDYEK